MNTQPTNRLTRRRFIRSTSAFLALPWLESIAGAQNAPPPRRIVNICTAFGLYGPSFFPEKAGRDYAPSEYLQILDGLREHYTVFSGISHPDIGGDHASEACFLTSAKHPTQGGFRNSISLDYLAAKACGRRHALSVAHPFYLRRQPADARAQRRGHSGTKQALRHFCAYVSRGQQERR